MRCGDRRSGRFFSLSTMMVAVAVVLLRAAIAPAGGSGTGALQLESTPSGAVVGAGMQLTLQISAEDIDGLEVEATLISPQIDIIPLEFAGDGLSSGLGTAHARFTPDMPGEYDLNVTMRGEVDGRSRSIRRSMTFSVARGEALYVIRDTDGPIGAGTAYPGDTAVFDVRINTRRMRGRDVEVRLGALEGEDGDRIAYDSLEYGPRQIPVETLPAGVDFRIPVPQDLPPGSYGTLLTIESETDRTAVPVDLEVLMPAIELSRGQIDLGSIRRGGDGGAELTVGLDGGVQNFEVTLQPWISRDGKHGPGMFVEGLERQFVLREGGEETIAVSIHVPEHAAAGRYHSTLVIGTPQQHLEVPVQARVTRPPPAARDLLLYALVALIGGLILLAVWDLVNTAMRRRALTPLQRFLMASALMHALALLLSGYLLFEPDELPETDRVTVRAVRMAGERGVPGAPGHEREGFLDESAEITETAREIDLKRAEYDHAEQRASEKHAAELTEELLDMRHEVARTDGGEVVEEGVDAPRRHETPAEAVDIGAGEVIVRAAEAPAAPERGRGVEVVRADMDAAEGRPDRGAGARMEAEGGVRTVRHEVGRTVEGEVVEEGVDAPRRHETPAEAVDIGAGEVIVRAAEAPAAPERGRGVEVARADIDAPERGRKRLEVARMGAEGEVRETDHRVESAGEGEILDIAAGGGDGETVGLGDQVTSGELVIGHGIYDGDWDSEMSAMPNLAYQLERRIGFAIEADTRTVQLSSPDIFETAFVFKTGHLDFRYSDGEIAQLRSYLRGGGSLWVNDSTHEGDNTFDVAVRRELERLFPDKRLETIPMDSALFTACYDLSRGYLGYDIPPGDKYRENRLRGLRIGGRWAVVYTRNDYGDGLEIDPNTHPLMESLTDLSPREMQEGSIRMGMNLAFYFLGSAGMEDGRGSQLAGMRRAAAEVPEIEEQKRLKLEGRASVLASEVLEVTEDWHVAVDWSQDPTAVDVMAGGDIKVELDAGAEGKNVVGKFIQSDLSDYRWMAMEVDSDMESGARLAIGLSTGEEFSYFESAPQYLRPGENPLVVFDLKADNYKTEATDWEYTAPVENLGNVRALHLLFYPIYGGSLTVGKVQLVR